MPFAQKLAQGGTPRKGKEKNIKALLEEFWEKKI
jgi:hypothetical protein